MRILIVSPKNRTVYNFRGQLIKDMRSLGHEVYVTGPNRDNVDKIEGLGAKFIEIPLDKTGLSITSDISYMRRLKTMMSKNKIDLVFNYTIKPVIYGSIAAKKAKVKLIYSMITGLGYVYTDDTFKVGILRIIVSWLYKYSLKFNKKVIFQNPDDLDQFVDLGIIKKNNTELVSGSGVDMSYFKREELPSKTTFMMLARVLKSKGVEDYLKAAKIVKTKYPDTEFLYLGDTETMKGAYDVSSFNSYVNNNIIKHYSETDDVRQFLKKGSVFVLPSYREGTPRSVLEAMSMGRAIITTDVPGCRETVKDMETGFLINKENPEELAKRMIEFIRKPSLIKTMGNKSHEYCKERFEVSIINDKMLYIMNIKEMGSIHGK